MNNYYIDEHNLWKVLGYRRRTIEEIEHALTGYLGTPYPIELEELSEDARVLGQDNAFVTYITNYFDEDMNTGEDIGIYVWYLPTNENNVVFITEITVDISEF